MEGKRKLLSGLLLGALIGGAAALFDKEARNYAKNKINTVKSEASSCIKNPVQSVTKLRTTLDRWNENFVLNAENTINALEQVEETMNKITKK